MRKYILKMSMTVLMVFTMTTSSVVAGSLPKELRRVTNVSKNSIELNVMSIEAEESAKEAITKDSIELPRSHKIPGDSKEWYLSQFNSGPYQNRNCGPAVVAMAVNWATPGEDKITVKQVRDTAESSKNFSTMNIREMIASNGINVEQYDYKTEMDIINRILEDKLVILCIKGDIVNSSNGHFVIVHGYRYYDDKLYFIINDPWTRSDREVSARVMHEEIMEWFDAVIVVSQVESYYSCSAYYTMNKNR